MERTRGRGRDRAVRTTGLAVSSVVAAALTALLTACGPEDNADADAGVRPAEKASTAARPTPTPTPPRTTESPTPAPSPTRSTPTPTPPPQAPPSPARTTRPAVPTTISMFASTQGGRITLERGGPAQEFTVSVHNGNTRAYPHLRVALQMEVMTGEAASPDTNGLILERRDPATGAWQRADLRVANDAYPHHLYPNGTPLAREASRVDRYRLRALGEGPLGSTPLLIRLVDTSAPENAPDSEAVPRRTSLMVTVT
ncbi:hypothetical protein ABT063_35765 [Streptomyces sp. NPDC002838]|uniref:hypothetical protein n=1 Tax=Streptomyces sp. NPDC002838 TaxID=3154436 RepID=UPI00332FA54E